MRDHNSAVRSELRVKVALTHKLQHTAKTGRAFTLRVRGHVRHWKTYLVRHIAIDVVSHFFNLHCALFALCRRLFDVFLHHH